MKKKFEKGIDNKLIKVYTLDILENNNTGEQIMNNNNLKELSAEAKEFINDLFEKCYSPEDIKFAMEDGAYLKEAGISQELSEEVHFFLTKTHIYEAIVNFYDGKDNIIKSAEVIGCNEKEINGIIEKSISEERDPAIIYGKIRNFCALK